MVTKELSEHRKSASDQSLGLSHQAIYEKALSLLSLSEGDKHLDFGCGQGRLLSLIMERTPLAKLTGVDLMEKPEGVPASIQWVSEDLNQSLSFEDGQFDSISAIEIIEHLENPRHIFRELFRVLKPGGNLVLSTPNNESWRSMLSYIKRGHFVAFTDRSYPAHITALNRKDLMRSAQEAGFKFKAWETSGVGCFPGVTSVTWQGLSFGALKGFRYCDNIFIQLTK